MDAERREVTVAQGVRLCQGCINLPATHDSDKLDDDSTSSESTTASDSSIDDDILAEEIITHDFNFEISDPA